MRESKERNRTQGSCGYLGGAWCSRGTWLYCTVLYFTVLYCTVLYWLPRWRLVQQRHVAVWRGHRAGGVAGQAATVVGGDSVAHAAVPSTSVIFGVQAV